MVESLVFLIKNQLSKLHMITSRKTDLVCNFCRVYSLLHDHGVQKESGTGMATRCLLAVFSSWLMVDHGWQMPEEQPSW